MTPVDYIIDTILVVAVIYISWRGLYKLVTGDYNNPVAEEDPRTQITSEVPEECLNSQEDPQEILSKMVY